METFRTLCRGETEGRAAPPERLNPLVLAYVGDAVFELFVRTVLADEHDAKAHALHVMSSRRVRAGAQAAAARGLFDELSEEERAVFLRGRNAKTHSAPRHAESGEYSYATALECLFGYLYLADRQERLMQLMRRALEIENITDPEEQKPFRA